MDCRYNGSLRLAVYRLCGVLCILQVAGCPGCLGCCRLRKLPCLLCCKICNLQVVVCGWQLAGHAVCGFRVVLAGQIVRGLQVAGYVGPRLQAVQALGCNWQPGACDMQAAQVVVWENSRLQGVQGVGPRLVKL